MTSHPLTILVTPAQLPGGATSCQQKKNNRFLISHVINHETIPPAELPRIMYCLRRISHVGAASALPLPHRRSGSGSGNGRDDRTGNSTLSR
ncbi:hypothetical protein EVAR_52697_1 [Eumeta japonica]|uniref:Uncharacterized protein n=1 Tax=Eumeta variegata TaxID=151549 RepID=A0A4C1Y4W2_EUMVA|nr:hypothetical protein EVAR_52697_1 [Eumeta japonica]